MRSRSTSTSGSLPSSALVTAPANSGSSATSSAMCRSTSITRSAGSSNRRRGRGERELAPEHLGDQMLLRREVGVRGRRADAGLGGHPPHGQPGESVAAEEVDRGPAQPVDGVGLFGGQTAPGRLQRPDRTRVRTLLQPRQVDRWPRAHGRFDDEPTPTPRPAAASLFELADRSPASCPPTRAARSTTRPSAISATASASRSAPTAASRR